MEKWQPWERVVSLPGTDLAAGGQISTSIYQTRKNQSLVILSLQQFWLDKVLDPMDPSALTAFQTHQDYYGRYSFQLTSNGEYLFNVQGNVYDPNTTGVALQRKPKGFVHLNDNLLGAQGTGHHSAVLVGPNKKLAAEWRALAAPGNVPTALACRVRGYLVPENVFDAIKKQQSGGKH